MTKAKVIAVALATITTGTIVDATLIQAPSSTQKPRAEPGSGDASGQEGETVVLRDEGPCGGGQ